MWTRPASNRHYPSYLSLTAFVVANAPDLADQVMGGPVLQVGLPRLDSPMPDPAIRDGLL
ncbi:MAG TPA: hypothetical protein VJA46_10675 [Acidimicrobiia bacterium]|nr:hypothetical protein [Acidimicrobiia bacterium]